MSKISYYGDFPLNGPQAEYQKFRSKEVNWIGADTEARYRSNRGHPIYQANDISYSLNRYGYRCGEFSEPSDFVILSIGCSFVFGTGMPKQELFHEIFTDRLRQELAPKKVVNFNLGSDGASNEHIFKMLILVMPLLKPNIVLINFSYINRRDYFSLNNCWIKYISGWTPGTRVEKELYHALDKLISPYNDELVFFRCFHGIKALVGNTCWLYSGIDLEHIRELRMHIDWHRYVGDFKVLDTARDFIHPGRESHAKMANNYWNKFKLLGEL